MTERIPDEITLYYQDRQTKFKINREVIALPLNSTLGNEDKVWKLDISDNPTNKLAIAHIHLIKRPFLIENYNIKMAIGIDMGLLWPKEFSQNPWMTIKANKDVLQYHIVDGIKKSSIALHTFIAEYRLMPDSEKFLFDEEINKEITNLIILGGFMEIKTYLKQIPVFIDFKTDQESPSAKEILEIATEGQYEVTTEVDEYFPNHSVFKGILHFRGR